MPWITAIVLPEDIENSRKAGNADDCMLQYCPVERAVCRALVLPLGRVCATYDHIDVDEWKDYALVTGVPTKKMRLAMERFDATGHMTPASFRIKVEPVE